MSKSTVGSKFPSLTPLKDSTLDQERKGGDSIDALADTEAFGYQQELIRNRSLFTLLFQSLAIAAIPYGEGSPLINAVYGGGQLSIFVGWIICNILSGCTACSLAELASRYPTSGGPSYWAYKLVPKGKNVAAYITGWVYLIGNWTITLSVNFGFASLLSGTIAMYYQNFTLNDWQLMLIFYGVCLFSLIVCTLCNKWLPMLDTFCAGWTAMTIIVILITLSVTARAGRHSVADTLGHYDPSYSGWRNFSFFIGWLPSTYPFSAIGMIASMAEEVDEPSYRVPRALSWSIPVGLIAGLFFVIPICATLPPLQDILNAPNSQALPYIFHRVTGSPGGGVALMFFVLVITLFCSISCSVAASRCTWALARDNAIPGGKLWSRVSPRFGVPVWSLVLMTIVQMLLGLINLGSTLAFTAFVSVGVQALALSYALPIMFSLWTGRREVNQARWTMGPKFGPVINYIAVSWISFELVLFSMPTALPVSQVSMNYSSVVLVGFLTLAGVWYIVHANKSYNGPPSSDGIRDAELTLRKRYGS